MKNLEKLNNPHNVRGGRYNSTAEVSERLTLKYGTN
jgi:hypothetical protein